MRVGLVGKSSPHLTESTHLAYPPSLTYLTHPAHPAYLTYHRHL